jgi:hypothetical protein
MTYAERLKLRRRQLADKRNPAAVALAQIAAAKAREKDKRERPARMARLNAFRRELGLPEVSV